MRMVRRCVIIAVFVAIASGSIAAMRLGRVRDAVPSIAVNRDAYNWGNVQPGSEVQTTFNISNAGGGILRLGDPKASCGCTVPSLSSRSLRPGDRTNLVVGFHVPTTPGRVRHSVTVPTNDPRKPVVILNLFAESWVGVRANPQAIDAGRVRPKASVERMVQLFSPDGKPFRIGRVACTVPEVRCTVASAQQSLPIHRLDVTFCAGERLGMARGIIEITTDRTDAHWVDIPVIGRVVGPISVAPSGIEIEQDEIGREVRRTVFIQSEPPARAIKLSDVKVGAPWELITRSTHTLPRGGTRLDLLLRFPDLKGSPAGELLLSFVEPENAHIRVPLTIRGWVPPLPESP